MILFFGPVGAGKSVQGKLLAARHDWKWVSTGEIFRASTDPGVKELLNQGHLIDDETTHKVLQDALEKLHDQEHIILDGFPRNEDQTKWLLEKLPSLGRKLVMAIVLEVPDEETIERLTKRGRHDDTPEAIKRRLDIYYNQVNPVIDYLAEKGVPVARVDGTGKVGEIHDRVEDEVQKCLPA